MSTYGAVVGINLAANLLTVEKSSGEQASYDPRRLTGVSVYREIDREFSVGDRIQFTAPDKSLGVANRDLAAIESVAPDGRISARLDNNRQVEFNAQEHRHFDHGYSVTSHSSQGLTAERVLVNADTGVHPDLLNSRFGYVSISRASQEAMRRERHPLLQRNIAEHPVLYPLVSAHTSWTKYSNSRPRMSTYFNKFLNNEQSVFWSHLTGLFVAQCWIVLVRATHQLATYESNDQFRLGGGTDRARNSR